MDKSLFVICVSDKICKFNTKSVVFDTDKRSYMYISGLAGEHAFSLTGLVCESAHVTFGGSSQLPDRSFLTHVIPTPSLVPRLFGGGSQLQI